MDDCPYGIEVQLYCDHELSGTELEEFSAHLAGCDQCQEYVRQAVELQDLLQRSRPLVLASDELRSRVAAATAGQSAYVPSTATARPWKPSDLLRRLLHAGQGWTFGWRVATAAMVLLVAALALVPALTSHVKATSYADAALATHRMYLAGSLPPEILSSSPELVTAWFAGKVPFDFHLPMAQPSPDGQRTYRLVGARLVNFKDSYAALVVYEMSGSKISLMVTSSKSAVPSGGDEVRSGGLTFHFHKEDGSNVITWSNHGLSYALVSSVQGSPRGSCLVCHQDMKDRDSYKDPH